tara:strand:- start:692 stop:2158 length:1467 start_codon:yes stop_codon:yes gene_type:complete
MLGADKQVVICGRMGYHWFTTAVACLVSNTPFIALPESLHVDEKKASLEGLSFDGAVLDQEFLGLEPFKSLPKILLEQISDIVPSEEGGQSILMSNSAIADGAGLAKNFIAFTSGSTASKKLKAFPVSLASSLFFTKRFVELYDLGPEDNWLICHTFSHIVHFEYALGGLFWGYDITLSGVLNLLMQGAELAPSVVVTVPSVYEKLAQQIELQFARDKSEKLLDQVRSTSVFDDQGEIQRVPLSVQAKSVLGSKIKMMLIGASPSPTELQVFLLQNGLPLYEGYGMSETNMICCNTPDDSKISTVGLAWPGIELKLDDQQCICVRTAPQRADRYLNVTEAEQASSFMDDGWVNTGDIGEIDEQGFVRIVGRTKDVIVNSGGKNINPSAIETLLSGIPGVGHSVVVGDGKPYLVALLAPLESQRLPDRPTLDGYLDNINANLPDHEKVLAFVPLEQGLNEMDGTLTRSGKARRHKVIQQHETEIATLYG